jgi:hypothetical protein
VVSPRADGQPVGGDEGDVDGEVVERAQRPVLDGREGATAHPSTDEVQFDVRAHRDRQRDGHGVGDHGQRPVVRQQGGERPRGGAGVEDDRPAAGSSASAAVGDPRLLVRLADGPLRHVGLGPQSLHRDGAAVDPAQEPAVLEVGEVAPHGLRGHGELGGEDRDLDAAVTAGAFAMSWRRSSAYIGVPLSGCRGGSLLVSTCFRVGFIGFAWFVRFFRAFGRPCFAACRASCVAEHACARGR